MESVALFLFLLLSVAVSVSVVMSVVMMWSVAVMMWSMGSHYYLVVSAQPVAVVSAHPVVLWPEVPEFFQGLGAELWAPAISRQCWRQVR
ncbi:MAG: hypothetical protein ACRDTC_22410 [Pseudonocardiaceae bacterium]